MPAPSPLAGVDITADAGAYMLPVAAFKTADQSVTNSIVLVNDNQLVIPVLANATYEVFLELFWQPVNSSAVPGLQFGWTLPAGATWLYRALSPGGAVGCATGGGAITGISAASGGTDSTESVHGSLIVGGTAGNLQLQFAQSTSNATSTTVKAGSLLVARRIA